MDTNDLKDISTARELAKTSLKRSDVPPLRYSFEADSTTAHDRSPLDAVSLNFDYVPTGGTHIVTSVAHTYEANTLMTEFDTIRGNAV